MSLRTIWSGLILVLIAILLPSFTPRPSAQEQSPGKALYAPAEQVGTIVDRDLSEASGLAASVRKRGLFWVINDSGNPPDLFAITPDGNIKARYTIADTPNYDWEDLAAFSLGQTPYLLIADVGDNLAGRNHCVLYIVREPEVPDVPVKKSPALKVQWRIRFKYPEGPRDCEAVAVDTRKKRVLLLSKRDRPPILYELPLIPDSKEVAATAIGPMTTIPLPSREDIKQQYGFTWSRPTAMDLSADGNRLVVLTYKNAYAYIKSPGQAWRSVVTEPAVCVILPHPSTGLLPIREALCIQPETGDLFVTGEAPPAPVFRLRVLPLFLKN